ncbi:MAG: transposase [Patescibacteria group bacterium]
MANRKPIEIDEWYHCYNRGVDKRRVFLNKRDYERMLILMYLAKHAQAVRLFGMTHARLNDVLGSTLSKEDKPIVEIGAYALMPNHFHFVLKEVQEGGISLFMQKVFTGYTMYFNQKNARTGALFAGTFKSKHIEDDQYLKHLVSYVHLNPAELIDPLWKEGTSNKSDMEEKLRQYPYSSLPEFLGVKRPHRSLLNNSIFELFEKAPTLQRMIHEAKTYRALQSDEVTDEVKPHR